MIKIVTIPFEIEVDAELTKENVKLVKDLSSHIFDKLQENYIYSGAVEAANTNEEPEEI